MKDRRYIFTLTAGRTGTKWLANFLKINLKIESIHEPLSIDDFGTQMPEIRLMRSFNDRGNTQEVQHFFQKKLGALASKSGYVETNHVLAKCGLIENLQSAGIERQTKIIILKRNLLDQCLSYVRRRDFNNITIIWQWYLDYNYRNVIVPPRYFAKFNDSETDANISQPLWYCHEIAARQIYYRQVFGDRIRFLECNLEELLEPVRAMQFLQELERGSTGIANPTPTLPEAANRNQSKPLEADRDKISAALEAIDLDLPSLVEAYIKAGRRLDQAA